MTVRLVEELAQLLQNQELIHTSAAVSDWREHLIVGYVILHFTCNSSSQPSWSVHFPSLTLIVGV